MKRIWAPLFGVGVLAALVVAWFYRVKCQISYGLDFGSLFDAIALVLVAIIFEYAYSRQSSDKRADTDLLLETVKEAKAAVVGLSVQAKHCEGAKALTPQQRVDLQYAEKEVQISVHSIDIALTHCKANREKLEFDKLKLAMWELKESLTDTPYPGPYDGPSRVRIQKSFKALRDELTRIAFAINRR